MFYFTCVLILGWLGSSGVSASPLRKDRILGNHVEDELAASDPTVMLVAGGTGNTNVSAEMTQMDDVEYITKENMHCHVPDLPYKIDGNSLVMTAGDHRILNCGGENETGVFERVPVSPLCHVLDVSTGLWKEHSNMTSRRVYQASVTMPDGVYILGGMPAQNTTDFLPSSGNTWQKGPALPLNVSSACAVRISDEEFVLVGGVNIPDHPVNNRVKIYTAVRTYNVIRKSWTTKTHLIEKRFGHSCAFHAASKSIIVTGGTKTGEDPLDSTEFIPTDTWVPRKAAKLNKKRLGHSMLTVDGKYPGLYVVGGATQMGESVDPSPSIEEWNQDKEEWTVTPFSLKKGRYAFGSLSVPSSLINCK